MADSFERSLVNGMKMFSRVEKLRAQVQVLSEDTKALEKNISRTHQEVVKG
jgi:hypothetical protein